MERSGGAGSDTFALARSQMDCPGGAVEPVGSNATGRRFVVSLSAPSSEYRASLPAIWSALIAVYLIWGSTYLAIRYAVETTPPFLMAGVRFMISGAFLYVLRRAAGDPTPKPLEWRNAAIIGTFLLVGGNGGCSLGRTVCAISACRAAGGNRASMDGAHGRASSKRPAAEVYGS